MGVRGAIVALPHLLPKATNPQSRDLGADCSEWQVQGRRGAGETPRASASSGCSSVYQGRGPVETADAVYEAGACYRVRQVN
jgi:hypothetical protein